MKRVAICIPTYERWFPEFRRSFQEFYVDAKERFKIAIVEPSGKSALIHLVRDNLAKTALAMSPRPDYVMFIDTDMIVPQGALDVLVKREKQVVAGVFHRRGHPYDILAWKWRRDPDDEEDNPGFPLLAPIETDNLGTEPIKIGACGFGCILIKTDVFDAIGKPWFMPNYGTKDAYLGEDVLFCKQCHKADVQIWMDPTVAFGHVCDQHVIVHHHNYKELREGIYRVDGN